MTEQIITVEPTQISVIEPQRQFRNAGDYTMVAPDTDDLGVVELWINRTRRSNSENTRAGYRRAWRQFSEAVPVPLQDIDYSDLSGWVDGLVGAPDTIKTRIASIKSLFSFIHKLGYIRFNPGVMITAPAVPDTRHTRMLTEEEIHAMIAVTQNHRNKTLIKTLYSSGARVSELLSLSWEDVIAVDDGKAVLAIFGKGGKNREAGVSAGVHADLLKLRNGASPTAPVFVSNRGNALDRSVVNRIIRKAAESAGITDKSVSPHWFRHSHVTHSLAKNANIVDVQSQAGHASLATTTGYSHSSKSSADVLAI